MKLKLLSYNNNTKLKGGNIPSFGLPAGETCLFRCAGCYASKGKYGLDVVKKKRDENYAASQKPDFINKLKEEIEYLKTKKGVKYVRIHDSGDFYSKEYIDKIYQVFKDTPDVIGYAYTKRVLDKELSKELDKLRSLPNFILINSIIDGKPNYYKDMKVLREVQQKTGAFVCPANLTKEKITCNNPCKICFSKSAEKKGVLFKAH